MILIIWHCFESGNSSKIECVDVVAAHQVDTSRLVHISFPILVECRLHCRICWPWNKRVGLPVGSVVVDSDGVDANWPFPNKPLIDLLESNADTSIEDSQAPRPRITRSWTCRKAPQTSRRSWSCWWSAPPPVGQTAYLHDSHLIYPYKFQNQLRQVPSWLLW